MGASSSSSSGRDDDDHDEEQQSLLGSTASSLKSRLGLAAPPPPPPPKNFCERITRIELNYSTRLAGFASCFILGWMLSLMAISSFGSLLLGNPLPFAFKYTLGNVLSMGSFCFLQGPARQLQGMCSADRRVCTFCYLLSLALTLYFVFALQSKVLTVLGIAAQMVAAVFYALSYLPTGLRYGITRRIFGIGM